MEAVYTQHSLASYLCLLHLFNCYHFVALCKWTEIHFNKVFASLKPDSSDLKLSMKQWHEFAQLFYGELFLLKTAWLLASTRATEFVQQIADF